jgi:hypothetical protein
MSVRGRSARAVNTTGEIVRKTVVAGAVAAGAVAAALAVGGVAYANSSEDTGGGNFVRVVTEDDGRGAGWDCPGKGSGGTAPGSEAPGQAPAESPVPSGGASEAAL